MRVSPRMKPGPPVPSTIILYESGACLSVSLTLPSKVPFTPPTPTFIVALYSSGAIASSFSQPGMAFLSCLGSWNASQTFLRGAGTSYVPSSFMRAPPLHPHGSLRIGNGSPVTCQAAGHRHGRCNLPAWSRNPTRRRHRNEKNAHCRLRGGAQPRSADRLQRVAHGPRRREAVRPDAIRVPAVQHGAVDEHRPVDVRLELQLGLDRHIHHEPELGAELALDPEQRQHEVTRSLVRGGAPISRAARRPRAHAAR